jgi:hypothetical protein
MLLVHHSIGSSRQRRSYWCEVGVSKTPNTKRARCRTCNVMPVFFRPAGRPSRAPRPSRGAGAVRSSCQAAALQEGRGCPAGRHITRIPFT